MEESFQGMEIYSAEEVPEVPEVHIFEPLVINKRGRSYLKNVAINAENPALLIGWYDDRVEEFVDAIKKLKSRLPLSPDFLDIDDELTSL